LFALYKNFRIFVFQDFIINNFDCKRMAHHKSALKRIRQTRTLKLYNRQNKKLIKEAVKAVYASSTYSEGFDNLKVATKLLDRLSLRNVLHKNTAANKKSAMAKFINKLAGK
jgi:small subunit ribosomal protein S20